MQTIERMRVKKGRKWSLSRDMLLYPSHAPSSFLCGTDPLNAFISSLQRCLGTRRAGSCRAELKEALSSRTGTALSAAVTADCNMDLQMLAKGLAA